ncbi:hypothetical protein DAPPUDRAFT_108783 [Daphnia pulex]|uniref:Uncharacterized protein n=1 Tax=Daphnia pulex TaxID=6669 RepID=E9H159_DAPPU|nr:hypothetical protein DAPPUDRAFT_108783 [Daphnia pulex]|eukprot:EFX74582.1 hypothetical protein DAPPUDRAFT_108783 [Daphnia pulex]
MAKSFNSTRNLTGGEYKQKLYFVPCADNKPKVGHEISEPAIFRFLLNEETLEKFDEAAEVEIAEMLEILKDIDKRSKITQVEAYQSSMNPVTNAVKAYHVFIVFKSTSETADDEVYYWWSLEKGTDYITLQRSRNKENVKDKLKGEERKKVKPIKEDLKGKDDSRKVPSLEIQLPVLGHFHQQTYYSRSIRMQKFFPVLCSS